MDTVALVEDQIDDGKKLLDQLGRAGVPVLAAAWVKPAKGDRWSLYVATPLVEKKGPAGAYRDVYHTLRSLGKLWVTNSDIKLIGAGHPITRDLVELMAYYPGKTPTRTRRPVLGILPIDEAYIYPLPGQRISGEQQDMGNVRLMRPVRQLPRPEELAAPFTAEEEKDLVRLASAGLPRGEAEAWVREQREFGMMRPSIPMGTVVKARLAGWCGDKPEDDPNPMILIETSDGARGLTHKDDTEPAKA